jgi:hypothetical protein
MGEMGTMQRDAARDTTVETLLMLGLGIAAVWWIWNSFGKSAVQGVEAGTNALESGIAGAYEALTFGPPITVTGTLAAQSGQVLGPIASFPAATDSSGNTYLNVQGAVYQLGPRNAQGNFTAIPTGVTAAAGTATIRAGATAPPSFTAATAGTAATGSTYG